MSVERNVEVDSCGVPRREHRRIYIASAAFIALTFFSLALLGREAPGIPLRVVLAVLPPLAFAVLLAVMARAIARSDELQRQIQLEALGFAYPAALVLAALFGFLQREGLVPHALRDLRDVWLFLAWPYFIGLYVARRKYR